MPKTRDYEHNPIVEAILDIRVETAGPAALDALKGCQKSIRSKYPICKESRQINAQVSYGSEAVSASASQAADGFIFQSSDGKRWFQARRGGFAFNQLAPYPGWSAFLAEARQVWDTYYKAVRPTNYTRIALRYINRFEFPTPIVKLESYFDTYPEVAQSLPQTMAGFFFQFFLPMEDGKSVASITQTTAPPKTPESAAVILDVDLFRTDDVPKGDELWNEFETLRVGKNRIFEACITDAARELIY